MKNWKSFCTIFRFTLVQHLLRKGYRAGTLVGMLLCFFLPVLIMGGMELLGRDAPEKRQEAPGELCVYVVNQSGAALDLQALMDRGEAYFSSLVFLEEEGSEEELFEKAEESSGTLVMSVKREKDEYAVEILEPSGEEAKENAEALSSFLNEEFGAALGLARQPQAPEEETSMGVREVLNLLLPYLNCMLLYFLLLFYGQSVGGCVILEKTSKLMDTFLLSVKPEAMLTGKVLGTVCAAALQFTLWLACLAGGFKAGAAVVRWQNPDTEMVLVLLIESLSLFRGMFSLGSIALAAALVAAGFLLYCSLAAVGGAISGKPEDLSNANLLFVLALIISFFAVLGSSGFGTAAPGWLNWIPFTAVLTVPGQILTGTVGTAVGLGSLAVTLAASLLVILLAARIYRLMALYKGNLPGPGKIWRMLRESGK